jgi:glycosyltransferase involved in cell wall biosynthesis
LSDRGVVMLISVIVTTYNRPDALRAVLRALHEQTDPAFEVVVADDGSGPATQQVLRASGALGRAAGLQRVLHAWQPDEGFRAAAARNMAVAASRGSYLVFLDGDCIPRPDYVARHRLLAEPGCMVSGSRVLLSERFTASVLASEDRPPVHARGFAYWLAQRLMGRTNKVVPLLRFPDGPLRRYRTVRWKRIKSCNLAIWRQDFEAVNGFDESFVGWGHEDADLVLRLARFGIRRKGGAFSTEVFHLWHDENARTLESANRRRVEQRIGSDVVAAAVGLASHPNERERVSTLPG